jgi:hypothetical protein
MIETLMALWNRGVSGRLMVMVFTFFCISISISLLFVTAGSVWGSLFAHGRAGDEQVPVVKSALITATAPVSVASSPVAATPTATPNPCLASPTGANGLTPQISATEDKGRTSIPVYRPSATPTHRRKTPTPGIIVTPKPRPSPAPSPTLPAVTPTVGVTPTATTTPIVTPTVIGTSTVTPTDTPTVAITPTDTITPGVTPTTTASTPTPGLVPTDTTTPGATVTVVTTPTVTVPTGSRTPITSVTTGTGDTHTSNGGSVMSGTSSSVDSSQLGQGSCFSDNLAASNAGDALSLLQNFLWIILVVSLAGTALFCAQMYRVARRGASGR